MYTYTQQQQQKMYTSSTTFFTHTPFSLSPSLSPSQPVAKVTENDQVRPPNLHNGTDEYTGYLTKNVRRIKSELIIYKSVCILIVPAVS